MKKRIGNRLQFWSGKRYFLLFFWLIALLLAALIALNHQTKAKQFFGIAGSTEKSISFQYPVEVVNVTVLEGEKIRRGELLLEVRRYDLAASLAIVEDEIAEIVARRDEVVATTEAEIKRLEADKRTEQSKIDVQIMKLESQLKLNTQWAHNSSESSTQNGINPNNVLVVKLQGLRQQRIHSTSSYQATIDNLQQQLRRSERPEDAKLAVLFKRKQELERQVTALTVDADFSGRIGSVLFAKGEQVPKFSPILTLQGESTSFVKGYIHEAVLNELKIGQKVWVESITADIRRGTLSGRIESLGNRIVEYPERLKRSPLISAWGREVIVELDRENSILLGEKVVVLLDEPKQWSNALGGMEGVFGFAKKMLKAVYAGDQSSGSNIHAIDTETHNQIPGGTIEASGLVWVPVLKSFLMISDESSALYELSTEGEVLRQINIDGLKINDAESICLEQDSLYISASLSLNKAGLLKNKRRKLVQLRRDNGDWVYYRELDLLKVLRLASQSATTDDEARFFISMALQSESINIEAHQVQGNALFLGFKTPLNRSGQSVILKLVDLESLFNYESARVEIWQTIQLKESGSGAAMMISDMQFFGDTLYLTGVNSFGSGAKSGLWMFSKYNNDISHIRSFEDYKAEGVAIDAINRQAIVVFDGDEIKGSHYAQQTLQ